MDIAGLIAALDAERIVVPVVACGTESNAAAAVSAIRAGAKEYIPLPPDAELIAAVIAAVARESSDMLYRDPSMARVVKLADQVAASEASVLITGERHRQGSDGQIPARAVQARRRGPSSPSTAPPSPRPCSSPSCSATRRAPSPAPSPAGSASSRKPMAAPCCSTKSPRWTCACRPSSCAPSRSA